MSKRPYQDHYHDRRGPPYKRPSHQSTHNSHTAVQHQATLTDYRTALSRLPPSKYPTLTTSTQPPYLPTFTHNLPDLPPLSPSLSSTPFRHKSTLPAYDRTSSTSDLSYERLEFLGDAYLELFASRLIFARYSHLPAGRMSQLRELLVKNETLAEYAVGYGWAGKVQVGEELGEMMGGGGGGGGKGNKGFKKILGDVFEAYVAAVVLSDEREERGAKRAEAWVNALWSVKLGEQMQRDDTLRTPQRVEDVKVSPVVVSSQASGQASDPGVDLSKMYSATGKMDLQKRIGGPRVTLLYEPYRESQELKGAQLGVSRHFIALYLTGYGYDKLLLGKGEGKSKTEAGHRAAVEAMYGQNKALVDKCEAIAQKEKAEKAAQREAAEAAAVTTSSTAASD